MRRGHSKDTIQQAQKLIEAMRRAGVPRFHVDTFGLEDRRRVEDMVKSAKRHHSMQERICNGVEVRGEESLEKKITDLAASLGLTVSFDGDPRGFTVKLHAPNKNAGNTWGGNETGWGIG